MCIDVSDLAKSMQEEFRTGRVSPHHIFRKENFQLRTLDVFSTSFYAVGNPRHGIAAFKRVIEGGDKYFVATQIAPITRSLR